MDWFWIIAIAFMIRLIDPIIRWFRNKPDRDLPKFLGDLG